MAKQKTCENSVDKSRVPEKIVVLEEHLNTVLGNKKGFREYYKLATGFYPEDLAAERLQRGRTQGAGEVVDGGFEGVEGVTCWMIGPGWYVWISKCWACGKS